MAAVSTKLHAYPSHSFDCSSAQLRVYPGPSWVSGVVGCRKDIGAGRLRARRETEVEGSRKFGDFEEDGVKLLKGREKSGVLEQLKSAIVACSRLDDGFKASIAKIEEVFSSLRNSNIEQLQPLCHMATAEEINRRLEQYVQALNIIRESSQLLTKSMQHYPILLSTDVTFRNGIAWLEIISTNPFGSILPAWSFCSAGIVPMHGELDGINKASELVGDLNISHLILASDAKDIVDALQSNMPNMVEFTPELAVSINHIKAKLLMNFVSWQIDYIPRSSNFLAHNVAKRGSLCSHSGAISISALPSSIFVRKDEM